MSSKMKILALIWIPFVAALALMLSMLAKSEPIGKETKNAGQQDMKKCIELTDARGWSVDVSKPGLYCMGQDLHQSWPMFQFAHQAVPHSSLIEIFSANVIVDLKRHQLSSITPINGGIVTHLSGDENILPTIVRNGKIKTSKRPAVRMVDLWNIGNMRFGHGLALAASKGDLSLYKPTVFILENLTLKSDQHAVIMQGKRNVIRNCTIIGGNGTVNVYGPNLLFEGNTIILNAETPKTPDDEKPVALYLEDAADSIVRNNKIIIKGSGALNPNAIVLVNSPNVVLEHNTIRGTKTVYKLLDQRSSVKDFANSAK
jgi:hypothetical protein